MKKLLIYLKSVVGLLEVNSNAYSHSAHYENGMLYVYDAIDPDVSAPSFTVYNLKDGPIHKIENVTTTLPTSFSSLNMKFLQLPSGLPNGRSDQLWLMNSYREEAIKNNKIGDNDWTFKSDKKTTLTSDNSFISKPPFNTFPKGGYTVNTVNVNNNPKLYILGGFTYASTSKDTSLTNYFFEYDFNSDTWKDLSDLTKNIIPPIALHKTIQIGNSLVVLAGFMPLINATTFPPTAASTSSNYIHNVHGVMKFDITKKKWDVLYTTLNYNTTVYDAGYLYGPSVNVYNGKIACYGQMQNQLNKNFEPLLGFLDPDTWEWEWSIVLNEQNINANAQFFYPESVIINDQLLLINGYTDDGKVKQILNIDLKNIKFSSTLSISGGAENNDNSTKSSFPVYAIVLIVLAAVAVIAICAFLYYRKKKKAKAEDENSLKMQEVWANSEMAHDSRFNKNGSMGLSGNNKNSQGVNNPTQSSNGTTNTTLHETNIMNLPYFQHEVDMDDISPLKDNTQNK